MSINFILENWYIILALVAAGAAAGIAVYHFMKQPKADQLKKVHEWLLWAVIRAEKALGSGTGQLKLRRVYDLFVARFPWLAKIITFDKFSDMVKDALAEMQELLENNPAVAAYVNSGAIILDGIAVEDLTDAQLRSLLEAQELRTGCTSPGRAEYCVSDRVEDFERIASLFLQEDLHHEARRIDIEQY